MDEKYIITLYEKINLTDNIILYKKNKIIRDATIDFFDYFQAATYYDEDHRKISVEMLENPYTIVSDDRYCYDFATKLSDLKIMNPNCQDEEELYRLYEKDISKVFEISYYDSEEDRVKFLLSNEELLKEVEEDNLFSNFMVVFDGDDSSVNIQKNDIKKMIKMLEKKKYKLLKEQLIDFSDEIENADEYYEEYCEEFFKDEINEIKEEDISVEDSLKKLDGLIGLDNIKLEIMRLIKYLEFRDKSKDYLKLEKPNLHMLYTGNPGTGKTTVARIVSEILYKLGYAKNNKFVEITPKDLIAEYVGQTAVKTANLLNKNKGGVIFIDEAYVLASSAQQYAQEALVEIIKELEKNETVFIFAGYKDEMKKFMQLNPGLTSRIGYYLEYPDYNTEQLYQIFEYKISLMGFKIDDKLKNKIMNNLSSVKDEKHFGNGRYIDKLINKIILEHAINTDKNMDKKDLVTLGENDFSEDVGKSLIYKTKVKKIGFN